MSINIKALGNETHYSTSEAAKLLEVETDTVKRYCNSKPPRIKAAKPFGKRGPWLIPQSAIDAYIEDVNENGRPKRKQPSRKRRSK